MKNPFVTLLVNYIDKKFPLAPKLESGSQKKTEPRRKPSRKSSSRRPSCELSETECSASVHSQIRVQTKRVNSARSSVSNGSSTTQRSRSSTRSSSEVKRGRQSSRHSSTSSRSKRSDRPADRTQRSSSVSKTSSHNSAIVVPEKIPLNLSNYGSSRGNLQGYDSLPRREILVM